MTQQEIIKFLEKQKDWITTIKIKNKTNLTINIIRKGLTKLYKQGIVNRKEIVIDSHWMYQYKIKKKHL